jgi:hypothetical protein
MAIRTFPGTIGKTQPLKELPAAAGLFRRVRDLGGVHATIVGQDSHPRGFGSKHAAAIPILQRLLLESLVLVTFEICDRSRQSHSCLSQLNVRVAWFENVFQVCDQRQRFELVRANSNSNRDLRSAMALHERLTMTGNRDSTLCDFENDDKLSLFALTPT